MGTSYDLMQWEDMRELLYDLANSLSDRDLERVDVAVATLDELLGRPS